MASTSKKSPDNSDEEEEVTMKEVAGSSSSSQDDCKTKTSGKNPREKSSSLKSIPTSFKKVKVVSYNSPWDPSYVVSAMNIAPWALLRMKRDIMEFFREPPPDIFIVPDEEDLTLVHVMIVGPEETPYQDGFFNFLLRFPSDYPLKAPRVKFLTTSGGTIRFNPNLYQNGKVCLSILGTWSGPQWSAAQSLTSLLVSIRSILNENPYFNEPGYENHSKERSKDYNTIIKYETLRVAILESLDRCLRDPPGWPAPISEKMLEVFLERYSKYEELVRTNEKIDGRSLDDPFSKNVVNFRYNALGKQLRTLKELVTAKRQRQSVHAESAESSDSSQTLYYKYVDRLAKSGRVPDKALYDDTKYERKPEESTDDFLEFMVDDDDDDDEEAESESESNEDA